MDARLNPPTWRPWLHAHSRWFPIALAVGVLGLALTALAHLLREVTIGQVAMAARAIPPGRIVLSIALCTVSYTLLTFYDVIALRQIGRPLPYRIAALASFASYTFSHNLGLSPITGGSARYRVYSRAGLEVGDVARVFALASFAFWIGVAIAAGIALAVEPSAFHFAGESLSRGAARVVAAAVAIVLFAGFFLLGHGRTLTIARWSVPLPSRRSAAVLLAISVADLVAASGALWVLLPSASAPSAPSFFLIFALAMIVALLTHVPGGLGPFEAMIIAGTPHVTVGEIAAALLLYRVIYYWGPLALAGCVLTLREAQRSSRRSMRWFSAARRAAHAAAPAVSAGLAIVGALVLLVSGALPAIPGRLRLLRLAVPLPFVEASHISASLAGTALLLLAPALYRRLDGALVLARAMLIAGAVFSLLKGFDFEEALVCGLIALWLQANRKAFYRRTRLTLELLTLPWIVSVAGLLAFSAWMGFVAYGKVDYQNELWWQFAWNGDASRFLRGSFAAGVVVMIVTIRRLLAGAAPGSIAADAVPPTFAEVAAQERTEAFLALTGDKRFLRTGDAFLMYQVWGHSWIMMGDPVGAQTSWSQLLWQLREKAHAMQGRVLLYQVSPAVVALAIELGLSLLKYGEEAHVPLAGFSLEGPAQRPLRYAVRRAAREGAVFEIIPRAEVTCQLDTLRTVSDEWLARKCHGEKGFSVGRFSPDYIAQFDCAVVRVAGRVVAFANVLQTANRQELSVDLMRHRDAVPYGTMDFMFANLMQWGREQGFATFNLGMAPLAGLPGHRLAPLWARAGKIVFRHADALYGFVGLRTYKEKFSPGWEPRYIAGPHGLGMIRALFDLQSLINGKRALKSFNQGPERPLPIAA